MIEYLGEVTTKIKLILERLIRGPDGFIGHKQFRLKKNLMPSFFTAITSTSFCPVQPL
jgi:hypothetical protein